MQPKNAYYESRSMSALGPALPIASDIARHLQSRQYLGPTIVACQNPAIMLSATRKQWLRLARNLQKQRSSTLNAEDILRFTHTIMHMQHLQFAAKTPQSPTEAHIFFVHPDNLTNLPPRCLSLYVTTPPRASLVKRWAHQLADNGLLIDYTNTINLNQFNLQPKALLEQRLLQNWHTLEQFIANHNISLEDLIANPGFKVSTAIDDALDRLLVASSEFLRLSASFQHMLSLAQPLNSADAITRKKFELSMRLAHRTQALTPGTFGTYLLKNFGDKNAGSFFLRDAAPAYDDLLKDSEEETTYHSMKNVPLTTEPA